MCRQIKQLACGSVFALTLGTATTALAQDDATALPPNTGSIHLDLTVDWTSAYYFRGLLQEDDGFIIQPGIEVGFDLFESDSMSLGASVGIWNSFHDADTGATAGDTFVDSWYESDLYVGLSLATGQWEFGAMYIAYTAPNGAFSTIEELMFSAAYDDSDLWGGNFVLNPYVAVAFEVNDHGGTEDSYFEFGIAPGFSWDISDSTTIDFEVPVTIGLSIDDYYLDGGGNDDTFGYLDIGLDASLGLPVSESYGSWTLSAGVHALFLGDGPEATNGGDDSELLGMIGLAISY